METVADSFFASLLGTAEFIAAILGFCIPFFIFACLVLIAGRITDALRSKR